MPRYIWYLNGRISGFYFFLIYSLVRDRRGFNIYQLEFVVSVSFKRVSFDLVRPFSVPERGYICMI